MTRASKLPRYDEFNKLDNCFGVFGRGAELWRDYLDQNNLLFLELGAGKSEMTLALAAKYPQNNFLAIDLKSDRLWRAAKNALLKKLDNCAFVQGNILDLAEYIEESSVEGIWITFPDPYPKAKQSKRRMLNRNFLDVYKHVLKPGAQVRLKTDNSAFFAWAIEVMQKQKDVNLIDIEVDLHNTSLADDYKIMTTYEKKYVAEGLPIYYLEFSFV